MIWRGLLVSVRDALEAAAALTGGAAIIDVKEPLAGPLGAASAGAVGAVARQVGRARPWTMAAGELGDGAETVIDRVAAAMEAIGDSAAPPVAFKVGLAGMANGGWREQLAAVHRAAPLGVAHVAVAYADWRRAAAPAPGDVIEMAAALGCAAVLIDTFDKHGAGLLDAAPAAEIAGWVDQARGRGRAVALAGRVTRAEIPAVLALGPDVVALRSAVCSNGRIGSVDHRLVREAALACAAASTSGDIQL
jgi:uncharacterized protein (UPF0264 family)